MRSARPEYPNHSKAIIRQINMNTSVSTENEKKLLRWDLAHDTTRLYSLSCRGSSAGWDESRQYKARATNLT